MWSSVLITHQERCFTGVTWLMVQWERYELIFWITAWIKGPQWYKKVARTLRSKSERVGTEDGVVTERTFGATESHCSRSCSALPDFFMSISARLTFSPQSTCKSLHSLWPTRRFILRSPSRLFRYNALNILNMRRRYAPLQCVCGVFPYTAMKYELQQTTKMKY